MKKDFYVNAKYIIKDCPNLADSYYANGKVQKEECNLEICNDRLCKNIRNCYLKRIVTKCLRKAYKEIFSNNDDPVRLGKALFAMNILRNFDIEERE